MRRSHYLAPNMPPKRIQKRIHQKTCERCGKPFLAAKQKARFCGYLCSRRQRLVIREVPEGFKWCPACETVKPLEEFAPFARNINGRSCTACRSASAIRWRAANKERVLANERRAVKNPHRKAADAVKSRRRRVLKAGLPGNHTRKEWIDLCAKFDNRCVRCGDKRPLTVDHVIPISKPGATDFISNIQPLCSLCNTSKLNRHSTDYRLNPFQSDQA